MKITFFHWSKYKEDINVDAMNEAAMPHENYSENLRDVSGNTEEEFKTIEEYRVFNIYFESDPWWRSRNWNRWDFGTQDWNIVMKMTNDDEAI